MLKINTSSPYTASMTREQFLFYEVRTTAKLMTEGLSDEEVVQRIIDDNLFQYPTEKSLKRIAHNCIKRLKCMDDETLVNAIATQPTDVAKQIVCYDEAVSSCMGFYDYSYWGEVPFKGHIFW